MCLSIEQQRAVELGNQALHDAMVRVPGGSRFMRHGEPIKSFGPKLAAKIIGRTADEIRNMADPNKPDHRFYAEDLHTLLLEGMDPIWFEECLRDIGIICVQVPEAGGHGQLSDELLACGKEFGDVFDAIAQARDKKSMGGRKITRSEKLTIRREVDEAVAELYALLAAVENEV